MPVQLVAVAGRGILDPSTPVATADDDGLTRGDGCFEGCRLRTSADGASAIDKLDLHLARFARSTAALGLDFDRAAWHALLAEVCAAWTRPGEWALKLVQTRGGLSFLTVSDLPGDYPRQRRDGIRVITLPRGYPPDAFADAPWLLGGVKTLSYAVNMAAMRTAHERGADDVIFLAADGAVLETPTGTVVWSVGRTLRTVPLGPTGILGGTTVELLFQRAPDAGWAVEHAMATVDDLRAADCVWIMSSVRGPAPVAALDDVALTPAADVHAEVAALIDF